MMKTICAAKPFKVLAALFVVGIGLAGLTNPVAVEACSPPPNYTLTVYITGEGSVSPSGGSYASGTTLSLTPTADSGWAFGHWEDDLTGSSVPGQITMNSNKTVTAVFVQTQAVLTTSVQGGGSVAPASGTYSIGQSVNITATPNEGYDFNHWEGDASGSDNPLSLTMNADKHVTAVFTRTPGEYFLTTNVQGFGQVNPDGGVYTAGQDVTIVASTVSGFRFDHWEGDASGTNSSTTVTMDSDKSVTAIFVESYTLTVTEQGEGSVSPGSGTYDGSTTVSLTATPDSGWRFDSWSGDASGSNPSTQITMNSNKSVTATFSNESTLSVMVVGSGSANPSSGTYSVGESVTVTATPDEGWRFGGWSGDVGGSDPSSPSITVTMDSNVSLTATMIRQAELTVDVEGEGTVTPMSGTYDVGANVELVADAEDGWRFLGWTGDIVTTGEVLNFQINADMSLTATFIQTYTLSGTAQGPGSVSPSSSTYDVGTVVSVLATPDTGAYFTGWGGDVDDPGSAAPTNTVTMDGNKSYSASFNDQWTLSTSAVGGSIAPSGGTYAYATVVPLTAAPDTGYRFVSWGGEVDFPGSTSPNNTVTMTNHKFVTAVFVQTFAVSVSAVGDDGTATLIPSGTTTYDAGSSATYRAEGEGGHEPDFHHWEGLPPTQFPDGPAGDGSSYDNPVSFTVDGGYSLVAVFDELQVNLTTNAVGPGTVSPGSGSYDVGSEVNVTATPNQGAEFIAWSGSGIDTSGNPVNLNTNPTLSLKLNTDRSVAATFETIMLDLNVSQEGNGTVNVTPGTGTHPWGTSVMLDATPDSGWRFVYWEGAPVDWETDTNVSFSLEQHANITAVFAENGTYHLSLKSRGPGSATASPAGPDFATPTMVDLTATAAGGGFAQWDSSDDSLDGSENASEQIYVDADKWATAVFVSNGMYSLDVDTEGEGEVQIDPDQTEFAPGYQVELTAVAAEGWSFKEWKGEGLDGTTTNPLIITMDSHKSLTAVFVENPTVTVTTVGDAGSAVLSPSGTQTYSYGTSVTYFADSETHHDPRFHHWEGLPTDQFPDGLAGDGSSELNPVTFTVYEDIDLVAVYDEAQVTLTVSATGPGTVSPGTMTYTVGDTATQTAIPDPSAHFAYWIGEGDDSSGNPVNMNMNPSISVIMNYSRTLTGTFELDPFTLDVTVEGNGTVNALPGTGAYPPGTQIILEAVPDPGWRFVHWEGAPIDNFTYTTVYFPLNADTAVTAVFVEEGSYYLRLQSEGPGSATAVPPGPVFTTPTLATLTATPDTGARFAQWDSNDESLDGSTNANEEIMVDADKTATAIFTSDGTFSLNVDILGEGEVQIDPNQVEYAPGTSVVLTAYPDSGWRFAMWMSSDNSYDGDPVNPLTITMDKDQSLTAVFVPNGMYTLQVEVVGEGDVVLDPSGGHYAGGTAVTLSAVLPENFLAWGGDLTGADPVESLTMNQDYLVYAYFEAGAGDVRATSVSFYDPVSGMGLLPDDVIADNDDVFIRVAFDHAISNVQEYPHPMELRSYPVGGDPEWVVVPLNGDDVLAADGMSMIVKVTNSELAQYGLLRAVSESIVETCSIDATDSTDSDQYDLEMSAFDPALREFKIPARLSGTSGTSAGEIIHASADYLIAGGGDYIAARSDGESDVAVIQNQADWLYVSTHGDHLSAELFSVDPPDVDWSKDLNVVIIAACAVLDVDDLNNNYLNDPDQHAANPGRLWALTGPTILLGYNYVAPADAQAGDPQFTAHIVERLFERRFEFSESWEHAWGYANQDLASIAATTYNSCAIVIDGGTRTYWYWDQGIIYNTWTSISF